MTFLKKEWGRFPLGVWIALVAIALSLLGWLMQAYSLLNWEGAVALGLQNNSFTGDLVDKANANKEYGEAIADLLWPSPIAIIAMIGLFQKKFYGFVAAMMEFAICIYFPLFYLFQIWNTHKDTVIGALLLWAIPSAFGIIGLWSNRNRYKL